MTFYRDLISIPVKENGENFVLLPDVGNQVIGQYSSLTDMQKQFSRLPVRESVYQKLCQANMNLQKVNSSLQLVLAYGYRSLEIQKKYFLAEKMRIMKSSILNPPELEEKVHELVAVPDVAGHPTGGAIDVVIINNETKIQLDFGTHIFDFSSENTTTFSSNIDKVAKKNRFLLRTVLLSVGFAPYDGEWWHFSYGDKEWAFYYKKPFAIYEQRTVEQVKYSLKK